MGVTRSPLNAGYGKVMSSAQFSSMQDWNMPCKNGKPNCFYHGVQLGHGSQLTHIWYPDDLMLCATFSTDLIFMLEALIPELALCGLQLKSAKPKIFDNISLGQV